MEHVTRFHGCGERLYKASVQDLAYKMKGEIREQREREREREMLASLKAQLLERSLSFNRMYHRLS
jgi:hypothetical protein